MNAYVFPGQGAQFSGMGKELYEHSTDNQALFHSANDILGFEITKIMFEGSNEELKQTNVTQPAIFLHSVILAKSLGDHFTPDMAAGHSLGEFSALVACGAMSFEDGLRLVSKRANAMQKACETEPSTMAAVIGMEDKDVEDICEQIEGIVVPANYNSPGQLVISGSIPAVEQACEELKAAGAKRALMLPVGGAFHSPLMEPARAELEAAISETIIQAPICPIYQNVAAKGITYPETIKQNLIAQLTASVRWTQTMHQMITDGANKLVEVGPGKVLQGLIKKVDRGFETESAVI